jgi:quercetin dioxygenase-like cupin family protein
MRIDHDRAVKTEWGSMQWLVNAEIFANANVTFGYVEINAGKNNPLHYHPNSDEVLHLLQGELHHRIGDEIIHIKAGDTIFVPQGVRHNAVNKGTVTARMFVTYPTGYREIVLLEDGTD